MSFIKNPKASLIALIFFLSIFYLWFNHFFIASDRLSVIPTALNVNKILYANEDYFGAGIVIYELPSETNKKIVKYGLEYLNTTHNKNNHPHNEDGIFKNWEETPISINEAWTGPVMNGIPEYRTNIPQISNYLSRYNLDLDLEQHIESQIDQVIQSSGGYFAYQNVRLIIVSPSEKIVIYAYSR
jgi:hypothetical protein